MKPTARDYCQQCARDFLHPKLDKEKFIMTYAKVHEALSDFDLVPNGMPSPSQLQDAMHDATAAATLTLRSFNFNPKRILHLTGMPDDYTHTFHDGELRNAEPLENVKAVGIIARAASLIGSYGEYSDRHVQLPDIPTGEPLSDNTTQAVADAIFSNEHFCTTLQASYIATTLLNMTLAAERSAKRTAKVR